MDINVVYFDHQITARSIAGDYYLGGYSTYKDVIIGQTRRTAQKIPVRAPPVVENVTTESSNILKSSNSITFGISYTDLDATDNITAFYKIDDAANYTQYNETFHITSSTGTLTLTCDLPSERTLGEHKIYVMLVDSNDFESNTDKFLKFYIREKPQLTIDSIDKLYYLPGESFIATISISDQDQSDSEKIEYRLESASEYTTLSEGVSASNSIRLPSITIPENSSSSPLKYMIRVTDSYGFSDEKSIDVPLHFKPTITIDEIPTKESFVHGDNIIIHGKATDEDEDDVVTITLNVNNDHYTTTVLANGTDKSFSFNVPVKQEYAIGTLSITVTGVDLYSLDSNQVDLSKPLYFIPVITSVQTVDQQYVSPSNTIKIKVSIQDLDSNDQLTVYYKRQSDTEFTSLPALQTADREGTFDIPISETATTGDFTITFKVTDSHSLTSQPSPFVVQVRIPPKVQDLSPEKPFFSRGESVVVKGNIVDPDSNDEFTITIKFGDLTNSKTVQSAGETTPFSIPLDNVPIGDLTAEISAVDKFGFDSNKPTVAVKVRVAPVISDLSIAANKYKRGDEITLTFKLLDEDINDYVTFTGDISSAAFKDENHVPTTTTARETTLKVVIPEESKSGEDLVHLKAIDSQGLVSNELEHQIYILSNPSVKYEGKSNDGNSKPYDNVTIYFSVTNPDPDETVSVYIKIDSGEKIFVGNVTSPAEDVKLNYTYTVPGNQPNGTIPFTIIAEDDSGLSNTTNGDITIVDHPPITVLNKNIKTVKQNDTVTIDFDVKDLDPGDTVSVYLVISREDSYSKEYVLFEKDATQQEFVSHHVNITIPEDMQDNEYKLSIKAIDRAGLESTDENKILVNSKAQFGQDGSSSKFEILVDRKWVVVVIIACVLVLVLIIVLIIIIVCIPPVVEKEEDSIEQVEEDYPEKEDSGETVDISSDDVVFDEGEPLEDSGESFSVSSEDVDIDQF
ncbi:Bap-like [Trichomonas vaginalis G3]|uniref:Bap-like n=1 Tax=Trichomonas vaginalis (strain ATCC PRA-98 / G3) TaxID=412133 RepID=A2F1W5_TRIV3|nr:immunoglobulins domain-containing protein [Trichomonas vaginalis G3]EAY01110.1 Bap-like [Trichomonas vaginalis G3]KAI5517429.1 immunoglobulins domain-containing protein [Trichomonas vaginalis G3]|eukprot:XP_001313962.1 Bap-like [Trichomonas vaginalis G3]